MKSPAAKILSHRPGKTTAAGRLKIVELLLSGDNPFGVKITIREAMKILNFEPRPFPRHKVRTKK